MKPTPAAWNFLKEQGNVQQKPQPPKPKKQTPKEINYRDMYMKKPQQQIHPKQEEHPEQEEYPRQDAYDEPEIADVRDFDSSVKKEEIVEAFQTDSLQYISDLVKGMHYLDKDKLENIYKLAGKYETRYGKKFHTKKEDQAYILVDHILVKFLPNKALNETGKDSIAKTVFKSTNFEKVENYQRINDFLRNLDQEQLNQLNLTLPEPKKSKNNKMNQSKLEDETIKTQNPSSEEEEVKDNGQDTFKQIQAAINKLPEQEQIQQQQMSNPINPSGPKLLEPSRPQADAPIKQIESQPTASKLTKKIVEEALMGVYEESIIQQSPLFADIHQEAKQVHKISEKNKLIITRMMQKLSDLHKIGRPGALAQLKYIASKYREGQIHKHTRKNVGRLGSVTKSISEPDRAIQNEGQTVNALQPLPISQTIEIVPEERKGLTQPEIVQLRDPNELERQREAQLQKIVRNAPNPQIRQQAEQQIDTTRALAGQAQLTNERFEEHKFDPVRNSRMNVQSESALQSRVPITTGLTQGPLMSQQDRLNEAKRIYMGQSEYNKSKKLQGPQQLALEQNATNPFNIADNINNMPQFEPLKNELFRNFVENYQPIIVNRNQIPNQQPPIALEQQGRNRRGRQQQVPGNPNVDPNAERKNKAVRDARDAEISREEFKKLEQKHREISDKMKQPVFVLPKIVLDQNAYDALSPQQQQAYKNMGEMIMTQQNFMNYMAKLVPLCENLSGQYSGGSLAKYKDQITIFTEKIKKKETTNFEIAPGSAFKLRQCC